MQVLFKKKTLKIAEIVHNIHINGINKKTEINSAGAFLIIAEI